MRNTLMNRMMASAIGFALIFLTGGGADDPGLG